MREQPRRPRTKTCACGPGRCERRLMLSLLLFLTVIVLLMMAPWRVRKPWCVGAGELRVAGGVVREWERGVSF